MVQSSDKLECIQRAAARMVRYLIVTHVIRGQIKRVEERYPVGKGKQHA